MQVVVSNGSRNTCHVLENNITACFHRFLPQRHAIFDHQLIGATFEGTVIHLSQRIEGFRVASLIDEEELFDGMPSSFRAAESHSEAVSSVMPGFVHLAKSEDCEVEAFRHKSRPIYGVQFHPENSDRDNPVGLTVLSNFVKITRKDQ